MRNWQQRSHLMSKWNTDYKRVSKSEHDTVTPVFWAVTVSASDRCKSDIKLRFIEEYVDKQHENRTYCNVCK